MSTLEISPVVASSRIEYPPACCNLSRAKEKFSAGPCTQIDVFVVSEGAIGSFALIAVEKPEL